MGDIVHFLNQLPILRETGFKKLELNFGVDLFYLVDFPCQASVIKSNHEPYKLANSHAESTSF